MSTIAALHTQNPPVYPPSQPPLPRPRSRAPSSLPPPPSLPPPSVEEASPRLPRRLDGHPHEYWNPANGFVERGHQTVLGADCDPIYESIPGSENFSLQGSDNPDVDDDVTDSLLSGTAYSGSDGSSSVYSFSYHRTSLPRDLPSNFPRRESDASAWSSQTPAPHTYVNLPPLYADSGDAENKFWEMLVSALLDKLGAFGNPKCPDDATLFARSLLIRDDTVTEALIGCGYGRDGLTAREAHFLLGRLTCADELSQQGRTLIDRLKDLSTNPQRYNLAVSCDALLDKAAQVARETGDAELMKALYEVGALKNVKVVTRDRVAAHTTLDKAPVAQQAGGVTRFVAWFLSLFRWLLPSAVYK